MDNSIKHRSRSSTNEDFGKSPIVSLSRSRSSEAPEFELRRETIIRNESDSLEEDYQDQKQIILDSLIYFSEKISSLFLKSQVLKKSEGIEDSPLSVGDSIKNYSVLEKIGEGAFSSVFKCIDSNTDQCFALKAVSKKSKFNRRTIDNEIRIMKSLVHHSAIIRLIDSFESELEAFIVLELVDKGIDLFELIELQGFLKESFALSVFKSIVEGLKFIHGSSILHGDVKLENILIVTKYPSQTEFEIKIIDFGLSMRLYQGQMIKRTKGSEEYASPELILRTLHNGYSSDIWAAGVLLFAMLTAKLPFDPRDKKKMYHSICSGIYKFPPSDTTSNETKIIISKMLHPVWTERVNAAELSELLVN